MSEEQRVSAFERPAFEELTEVCQHLSKPAGVYRKVGDWGPRLSFAGAGLGTLAAFTGSFALAGLLVVAGASVYYHSTRKLAQLRLQYGETLDAQLELSRIGETLEGQQKSYADQRVGTCYDDPDFKGRAGDAKFILMNDAEMFALPEEAQQEIVLQQIIAMIGCYQHDELMVEDLSDTLNLALRAGDSDEMRGYRDTLHELLSAEAPSMLDHAHPSAASHLAAVGIDMLQDNEVSIAFGSDAFHDYEADDFDYQDVVNSLQDKPIKNNDQLRKNLLKTAQQTTKRIEQAVNEMRARKVVETALEAGHKFMLTRKASPRPKALDL